MPSIPLPNRSEVRDPGEIRDLRSEISITGCFALTGTLFKVNFAAFCYSCQGPVPTESYDFYPRPLFTTISAVPRANQIQSCIRQETSNETEKAFASDEAGSESTDIEVVGPAPTTLGGDSIPPAPVPPVAPTPVPELGIVSFEGPRARGRAAACQICSQSVPRDVCRFKYVYHPAARRKTPWGGFGYIHMACALVVEDTFLPNALRLMEAFDASTPR